MISPDGKSALLGCVQTLFDQHLGEMVDACIRALRFAGAERGLRPRERRFAATSIIHGYAALEAITAMFRFELFENTEGRHKYTGNPADPKVVKLLDDWTNRRCSLRRRCEFLLEARGGKLAGALAESIQDVTLLRNMLAHGYAMPGLMLWDGPVGEQRPEIEVKHEPEFVRLAFSRPDQLTVGDARTALGVFLHAAHTVAQPFGHLLQFTSYEIDPGGKPEFIGGGAAIGPVENILAAVDKAK
jgi:hypothetical protein